MNCRIWCARDRQWMLPTLSAASQTFERAIVTIISETASERIEGTVFLDEYDDIPDVLLPCVGVGPTVGGWDGRSQPGKGSESTQGEANHVDIIPPSCQQQV